MSAQRVRPGVVVLLVGSLSVFSACDRSLSKSSGAPEVAAIPETPEAYRTRAAELRREGKPKEAQAAALKAYTLARTGPRVAERIELAKSFGAAGNSAGAINEIKSLEQEKRDGVAVDEVHIAEVYAQIGDPNAVFRWLGRAVEAKSTNLAGIEGNPDFGPVRNDPRWQPFLATLR